MEAPELAGGGANAIRRAVLIGTGSPGSENQCVALVRALGIASDNLTVYVSQSTTLPHKFPVPLISQVFIIWVAYLCSIFHEVLRKLELFFLAKLSHVARDEAERRDQRLAGRHPRLTAQTDRQIACQAVLPQSRDEHAAETRPEWRTRRAVAFCSGSGRQGDRGRRSRHIRQVIKAKNLCCKSFSIHNFIYIACSFV